MKPIKPAISTGVALTDKEPRSLSFIISKAPLGDLLYAESIMAGSIIVAGDAKEAKKILRELRAEIKIRKAKLKRLK